MRQRKIKVRKYRDSNRPHELQEDDGRFRVLAIGQPVSAVSAQAMKIAKGFNGDAFFNFAPCVLGHKDIRKASLEEPDPAR